MLDRLSKPKVENFFAMFYHRKLVKLWCFESESSARVRHTPLLAHGFRAYSLSTDRLNTVLTIQFTLKDEGTQGDKDKTFFKIVS